MAAGRERFMRIRRRDCEEGFTLLEYVAGAAVLAGAVFVALNSFSTSLQTFFTNLGGWVEARSEDIPTQPNP